MTISTFRIFFKKKSVFGCIGKFLVLKSFQSESFVRFWIRHIFTHTGGLVLDLHKRPPWNVFFISLGSMVLFKDSKIMVRFFGRRNFELFQCSAEGCRALRAQYSVKKSQSKCGSREHLKILPNNIMTLQRPFA